METHAQNSTFASPTHKPMLQLAKELFFADTPADNVKFVGLNNENKQGK